MHNYRRLVKGKDRCSLLMHPQDMVPRDIEDGAEVTISSRAGSVQVRVESSEDVMQGVVSLPHGYGHDRDGIRMDIARKHAGVSCNDITDELALDELSGNAAVNGVLVSVTPG
jgi:anaerobic selenocysteine-containing dehydrogenase